MKTKTTHSIARISVSFILCGMVVFWGFQVFGEDWTADWTGEQKEVWESVQDKWETFKKGDVKAALAFKHDDGVFWWSSSPIPLKKEFLENSYKSWFDYEKPTTAELKPLDINIFGNVANVYYLFKYKGDKLSDRSRVLETWIKQGNKWLQIGQHSSSCDKISSCLYDW
jgi:ketosteroid isomerase-like protein